MVWVGDLLAGAGALYSIAALLVMLPRLRPDPFCASPETAPVSVLKPLCGAEPKLYECLRSFCVQDYPRFQIICGVSDGADPAIGVGVPLISVPKVPVFSLGNSSG